MFQNRYDHMLSNQASVARLRSISLISRYRRGGATYVAYSSGDLKNGDARIVA